MTTSNKETGIVRTFDTFKGFGFIRRKKGKDVFVFYLDVLDTDYCLVEGDHVEFFVVDTGRGPKAEKVRKIS